MSGIIPNKSCSDFANRATNKQIQVNLSNSSNSFEPLVVSPVQSSFKEINLKKTEDPVLVVSDSCNFASNVPVNGDDNDSDQESKVFLEVLESELTTQFKKISLNSDLNTLSTKPVSEVFNCFCVKENHTIPHPNFGDICSLIISLESDVRPHVKISVLGRELLGLLDTGATCSVMGKGCEYLIFKLNLKKYEIDTSIKTADGSSHRVKYFVNLPVTFNNEVKILPILLIPSLPRSLILGFDFFKLFNLEITCPTAEIFSLAVPKVSVPQSSFDNSVNLEQIEAIKNLFPVSVEDRLGCTHLLEFMIDTGDAKPINQKHYYVSPFMQKQINLELDRMLKLDVIEPANGPWSNPIVCVKKKNGKIRLCLDSRKLNDVTVKEAYPLPHITRILGRLDGTKFLSSIDLSDAFWQIPLHEDSKQKTAFVVSSRGMFRFKRMPFGLCNAAQNLAKLMDRVLGYDLEPKVFVYLDDIIVATNSFDEHLAALKEVANRLKNAGLTINIDKSKFCIPRLSYLGYILDADGLHVDAEKVKAIVDYPIPKNIKEVRRFLGICGWYRRFIDNFGTKASQISDLLKKDKVFRWTEEADKAFMNLKEDLMSAPVLINPDFSKPFVIQCDASDLGVGGVLFQILDGEERVIAYTSQKLTSTQKKYMTCEKELLGMLHCIAQFRPYIEGTKFTVITDNSALVWLRNFKDPNGRLARWSLKLQHFDFQVIHKSGKLNVVADALSRAVVESVEIVSWYDKLFKDVQDGIISENLKIFNGQLFKQFNGLNQSLLVDGWKLVVPPTLQQNILYECHDSPLSAHMGVKKTINRVKEKYFWPTMVKDVTAYVNNCEKCKCIKYPTVASRPLMGKFKEADKPWEMISMDYIGPLPRSKMGNTMLYVVTDFLSKYSILKPMKTGKTTPLIRFLEEDVFLVYGVPRVIISDNGPQFISNDFKNLLKQYNVTHWLTSRYTPQYNPTERVNRVIMSCIRAYIENTHSLWDINIKKIACAINTAIHDTTKFSPFFINYGRAMITDGNQHERFIPKIDDPIDERTKIKSEELKNIFTTVKENIKNSSTKVAERYNLRARNIQFEENDIVYKKNFGLSSAIKGISAKLNDPYLKCKVKKRTGSNTYLLEDLNGKPIGIFHAKDIHK